jgi:hypothetical protein
MKTVFVSSTYQDLKEHRRQVWEVLEDFDVSVRGMEKFGARSEEPLETCINEVEQSDVYVGIIGHRLGSVHDEKGLSYTQLEYERASELDLDILVYLIDEEAEIKAKYIDKGDQREKLESFKRTLKERHTIDTFTSPSDLGEKIRRDFRRVLGSPHRGVAEGVETEYDESKEAINKFLLIPKAVSGREILLEVEFKGKPFPASRDICSAFNLGFGATVGVSIDIVEPKGFSDSDLSHLFIGAKSLDDLWPVKKGDRKHVYAKLQFTEKEISSIRTRFKSETRTYIKNTLLDKNILAGLTADPFEKETVHLEAEGNVILLFTKEAEYEGGNATEVKEST